MYHGIFLRYRTGYRYQRYRGISRDIVREPKIEIDQSPHVTDSSCSGITSLTSNPQELSSEELTIIATGVWEVSVSDDGSHSSKVRPEASSSTWCIHTSTTRAQSPSLKRRPLYSSYSRTSGGPVEGAQLELSPVTYSGLGERLSRW